MVELGAAVEGGEKRAGMEEKLGEGIERKGRKKVEVGEKGISQTSIMR